MLANYRHKADCLYFYLTLVRRTAERSPRGNVWQRFRREHKDSVRLAVNGVSVLTYEFFCKTAPSDNLSMRPALGKKREKWSRRVCKSRRQGSDVFTVKTDCKYVSCPLLSSLYAAQLLLWDIRGRSLQLSIKRGRGHMSSWHTDTWLHSLTISRRHRVYLTSVGLSSGKMWIHW